MYHYSEYYRCIYDRIVCWATELDGMPFLYKLLLFTKDVLLLYVMSYVSRFRVRKDIWNVMLAQLFFIAVEAEEHIRTYIRQ